MTNEEITNQLLENIKKGDKRSFERLVSLYEKTVYHICHRFASKVVLAGCRPAV